MKSVFNSLLIMKTKKSCMCVFAIVRNKNTVYNAINVFNLNTACTSLNLEFKIKLQKINWSNPSQSQDRQVRQEKLVLEW